MSGDEEDYNYEMEKAEWERLAREATNMTTSLPSTEYPRQSYIPSPLPSLAFPATHGWWDPLTDKGVYRPSPEILLAEIGALKGRVEDLERDRDKTLSKVAAMQSDIEKLTTQLYEATRAIRSLRQELAELAEIAGPTKEAW